MCIQRLYAAQFSKTKGAASLLIALLITLAMAMLGFSVYSSSKAEMAVHQVNAKVFQSESEAWAGVEVFRRYLDQLTIPELLELDGTAEMAIEIDGLDSNLTVKNISVLAEQVAILGADFIVSANLVRDETATGATVLQAEYVVDNFSSIPTIIITETVLLFKPTQIPINITPASTPGSDPCAEINNKAEEAAANGDSYAGASYSSNSETGAQGCLASAGDSIGIIEANNASDGKHNTTQGGVVGDASLGFANNVNTGEASTTSSSGPNGGAGFVQTVGTDANGNTSVLSQSKALTPFQPAGSVEVLDENGALVSKPALNRSRPIYDSRTLRDSADYIITRVMNAANQPQIMIETNGITGVPDNNYYLGSYQQGGFSTVNALCETIDDSGLCQTTPLASLCEGVTPTTPCITVDQTTDEIVIDAAEFLPGVVHFDADIRIEKSAVDSADYINTFLSNQNITVGEGVSIQAPNTSNYSEACEPQQFPDSNFFSNFPRAERLCDPGKLGILYRNLGNVTVGAGSYDENMNWSGGNIVVENDALLEGTTIAGGFISLEDKAEIVGALVGLGNWIGDSTVTVTDTVLSNHQMTPQQVSSGDNLGNNYVASEIPAYSDIYTLQRMIDIVGPTPTVPGLPSPAESMPQSVDGHKEPARIMWTRRL